MSHICELDENGGENIKNIKKNPALQPNKPIIAGHYVSSLPLAAAIKEIYPDSQNFKYPHGEAGRLSNDGSFISFNGRVGTVIYAYCDFHDKKNVPLSSTNRDDLLKLGLIQPK